MIFSCLVPLSLALTRRVPVAYAETATVYERESNNSKDTANEIAVNTGISGYLEKGSDEDWFKFSISKAGYFNITFEHTLISSKDSHWSIYIYDQSGVNCVDGDTDTRLESPGNSNSKSKTYGVPAGTYYLRVIEGVHWTYSSKPYTLTVNYTEASDWETENNNSKESADEITFNKFFHGAITKRYDYDWYQLESNSSREVAITFNHPVIDYSDVLWEIYLYDSSGVTQLLKYGRRGNTETATTDFIHVSEGIYYIKITGYNPPSIYYDYSSSIYEFSVVEKHDHKGIWETTVEPTCTDKGVSTKTCTICGQVETRDIDPLGHSFDDGKVIKKATPAQKGEIRHTCTICGEQYIEKDGHLLWVIPVACICGIILLIGAINYIRIMIKTRP